MEQYVQISKINDFIFCPRSVYLHGVYESFHEDTYHDTPQREGKLNHKPIDSGKYSTAKRYLQAEPVFSKRYNVAGKIDIYDKETKTLIERKTKIAKVYDGYRFQLYGQYFGLKEEGYEIDRMFLHSLKDNKRYEVAIPAGEELDKFTRTMRWINGYDILHDDTPANVNKCAHCIYRNLCTNDN